MLGVGEDALWLGLVVVSEFVERGRAVSELVRSVGEGVWEYEVEFRVGL